MSRVVRIDADVAAKLSALARPGENPNAVLRRLAGLPPRKPGPRSKPLR